jgi:hypothetical protein
MMRDPHPATVCRVKHIRVMPEVNNKDESILNKNRRQLCLCVITKRSAIQEENHKARYYYRGAREHCEHSQQLQTQSHTTNMSDAAPRSWSCLTCSSELFADL